MNTKILKPSQLSDSQYVLK